MSGTALSRLKFGSARRSALQVLFAGIRVIRGPLSFTTVPLSFFSALGNHHPPSPSAGKSHNSESTNKSLQPRQTSVLSEKEKSHNLIK